LKGLLSKLVKFFCETADDSDSYSNSEGTQKSVLTRLAVLTFDITTQIKAILDFQFQ
jgi:hypothetical protein